MVYKIVWTKKALLSYGDNMRYLEEFWTEQEVAAFIHLVEKKLAILSTQPKTGKPKGKQDPNVRSTIIHKRITLIYKLKPQKKVIELLLFWNTYQDPPKLKT